MNDELELDEGEQEEIRFKIVTGADEPDLMQKSDEIVRPAWPEFMLHDPIGNKHWSDLYDLFPTYQFALMNEANGQMIATANSIPLHYDGNLADLPDEGWDWAIAKGVQDHHDGQKPNLLCALQIVVESNHQDMGLSPLTLEIMRELSDREKLLALIAPVRPMLKSLYPLIPIDDYVGWTTEEGELFDPWLRVHARLGAKLIKPCPKAMTISGTVAEWEKWAEMRFPQSGCYPITGALIPVEFDLDDDRGIYLEPNVWMGHPLR